MDWSCATPTPRNQVETVQRWADGAQLGEKAYAYDPNGNLLSEADWMGRATRHTYDARNRRRTTTDRLSHIMGMEYDAVGNLVRTTDFAGNVTLIAHDLLDREVSRTVVGEGGGTITRTYYDEADPAKNLKTVTDAQGRVTSYEYNDRYQVTRIVDPWHRAYNPLGRRFEYDTRGNKTRETDGENHVTRFEYDEEDRLVAQVREKAEGGNATTSYDYSTYLVDKSVVQIDPMNHPTRTYYDPWDRVKKIVDPEEYSKESWYDGEGNIVLMKDGRELTRQWERDGRGLVTSYFDAVAGLMPTYTYEYTLNDKLFRKHRARTVDGAVQYVRTETQYDAEDRESTVTEALGLPEERNLTYLSRDGMGNPREVLDYNGRKTTFEYNAAYKVKRETDARGI